MSDRASLRSPRDLPGVRPPVRLHTHAQELPAEASLAGSPLAPYRHACAIVRSDDEAWSLVVPFVDEAGQAQERVAYVAPRRRLASVREKLAATGLGSRVLGMDPADELFSPRSAGRPVDPIWLIESDYGSASAGRAAREVDAAAGSDALRIVLHLEPDATVEREGVAEHEAAIERLAGTSRRVVVCLYDVRFAPPARILDAIKTHPLVVIGGALYENSLYTPADRAKGTCKTPVTHAGRGSVASVRRRR